MDNQKPKDVSASVQACDNQINVAVQFRLNGKLHNYSPPDMNGEDTHEERFKNWRKHIRNIEEERNKIARHIERSLSKTEITFSNVSKPMASAINWTGIANMTGTSIEDIKNILLPQQVILTNPERCSDPECFWSWGVIDHREGCTEVSDEIEAEAQRRLKAGIEESYANDRAALDFLDLNRETKVSPRPVSPDFIATLKDFGARHSWIDVMEKEHVAAETKAKDLLDTVIADIERNTFWHGTMNGLVVKHNLKWWALNVINNVFVHPFLPLADMFESFGWTKAANIIYRIHDRTSHFTQNDC